MTLPLIALRGMTVFPRMMLYFDIGREKSVKALEQAMQNRENVFLTLQKDIRADEPNEHNVSHIGTVAQIRQMLRLPGDSVRVLVEGQTRGKIVNFVSVEPFLAVEVEPFADTKRPRGSAPQIEALIREVRNLFESYAAFVPRLSPELVVNVLAAREPGYLADYIAQNTPIPFESKQSILEERAPLRRLERLSAVLASEIEILELENDIHTKVHEQINKNQRDYYLREQLKTIQAELGDEHEADELGDDYTRRILALKLPRDTEEKFLKEASRLRRLHEGSPESAVVRTYLDTVLELPWRKTTRDRLDIEAARRVLDRDHYGMQKIKERVLEFLAVKRLAPELKGQILCFVGPPGVGKTSAGISVAKALGRKMGRLSLGGVRDEADIRGHRKTYIGAMPGRIINAVKQAQSRNAVLLLDEIDKLGSDFRGDPASALLEVLDPELNATFRDHYVEAPFDLSDILFITTANTTDTIPRALLDRMEVLEMTSYTDEEKVTIATEHLIPKQLRRHGLKKAQLSIPAPTLREIISGYTRESGVRNLERELAAICRKAARRVAQGETRRVRVAPQDLEGLLGVRKYKPERKRGEDEVGVANGLAWTKVGGELLEVEAGILDGTGKVELTGNLGEIMKESAKAALSYIRSRAKILAIDPKFYKNKDIHIHFPEGAIPKDGPSAGITVATAMISALTNTPVRRDAAMTGEISLRGRVLPVGGLKEKTMAAYRAGIGTVIIPAENESDLQEIDATVREALTFVTADHMDTVLSAALGLTVGHEK